MNNAPNITIVIADDHEIFRDGFKLTLNSVPHFNVVGEASNGKELVEVVAATNPNVIVTDIKMPIIDGVEATKQIIKHFPDSRIIGLSMFDDDEVILDMLEAGALGYLVKNADKSELIEAVTKVNLGEPYNCRFTNSKLTKLFELRKKRKDDYRIIDQLNDRDLEIIKYLCEGLTSKEIAEKIFLSLRTVEGARLRIQEKLGVKNVAGLVIFAIKSGLYHP